MCVYDGGIYVSEAAVCSRSHKSRPDDDTVHGNCAWHNAAQLNRFLSFQSSLVSRYVPPFRCVCGVRDKGDTRTSSRKLFQLVRDARALSKPVAHVAAVDAAVETRRIIKPTPSNAIPSCGGWFGGGGALRKCFENHHGATAPPPTERERETPSIDVHLRPSSLVTHYTPDCAHSLIKWGDVWGSAVK